MKANKTGYPSIEKPWLKYYSKESFEQINNYPKDITIWDYIKNILIQQGDKYPAMEYFGEKISRSELIETVDKYAKALKEIGVEEDEVIAIYSPWFPEIVYFMFAINMIGACSYFLKFEMSKEALNQETSKSRIAIVYDGMWDSVSSEFIKDKFEYVIFVAAHNSMASPLKQLIGIRNYCNRIKEIDKKKYFYSEQFIKAYSKYDGSIEAKFKSNRTAFITSSSGTSGKYVKGIMTTNESAIIQQIQPIVSGLDFFEGARSLVNLPPTAATVLNCLFLNALCYNATAVLEPRVSEKDYYKQVLKYKPQITIMTGAFWETFFRNVEKDIKKKKRPDLSFLKMPIIGGDGSTKEDIKLFNRVLKQCNCKCLMMPGYGMSETFSTVAFSYVLGDYDINKKRVALVGTPYPGVNVGIHNKSGDELTYNQRGELWIKTPTAMKGYFNKEKLTKEIFIDNWIHTGDIFEIDEDGILYFYGRIEDSIKINDGNIVYLFDITNTILDDKAIKYAMVNDMGISDNQHKLAAHIVLNEDINESLEIIIDRLNNATKYLLTYGICIKGYKFHKTTFLASPTTAKKDRKRYKEEKGGYVNVVDGKLINIDFLQEDSPNDNQ